MENNYVSGTNIGILISSNSNDNILTDNNVFGNKYGIQIYQSDDNTLTNNTASGNTLYAIFLHLSRYNTLTGNTAKDSTVGIGFYLLKDSSNNNLRNNESSNNLTGIQLQGSSNNTVTSNTVSSNSWGIRIRAYDGDTSIENQVYNNNFENTPGQQAEVYKVGTGNIDGNVFNLALPTGGNYWSDYTGIDSDGDGFGDTFYTFTGGQDELPLVPSPETKIEELIVEVGKINGEHGISNSLDAKLENAHAALEAKNAGQRQDAVNKMEAFINAVEAQRGNKITDEQANDLVAKTNYIISLL